MALLGADAIVFSKELKRAPPGFVDIVLELFASRCVRAEYIPRPNVLYANAVSSQHAFLTAFSRECAGGADVGAAVARMHNENMYLYAGTTKCSSIRGG